MDFQRTGLLASISDAILQCIVHVCSRFCFLFSFFIPSRHHSCLTICYVALSLDSCSMFCLAQFVSIRLSLDFVCCSLKSPQIFTGTSCERIERNLRVSFHIFPSDVISCEPINPKIRCWESRRGAAGGRGARPRR
jgi:hypothetical protein